MIADIIDYREEKIEQQLEEDDEYQVKEQRFDMQVMIIGQHK